MKNGPQVKIKKRNESKIILSLLIAFMLLFVVVRLFVFQTFFIPAESMAPLLHVKDKLIANKLTYRFRTPRRGEVIVFQPPPDAVIVNNPQLLLRLFLENSSEVEIRAIDPDLANNREKILAKLPVVSTREYHIKRVIGVAGDRIRIVVGEGIYLNGKRLAEPYLSASAVKSQQEFPAIIREFAIPTSFYDTESLNNKLRYWFNYNIIYRKFILPNIVEGEFVVPKKSVFVMGDNRANSFDSRYWGVVPLSQVKSRAIATFWPPYYDGKSNIKSL